MLVLVLLVLWLVLCVLSLLLVVGSVIRSHHGSQVDSVLTVSAGIVFCHHEGVVPVVPVPEILRSLSSWPLPTPTVASITGSVDGVNFFGSTVRPISADVVEETFRV